MFIPIVQLVLFYYGLGEPHGLKLAIVNDDVKNYQECFNSSWRVYTNENDNCQVERASCLLVDSLSKHFVAKQFFPSYEEAYHHFRHGGAIALLHIKQSFSESCNNYLQDGPKLQSVLITDNDIEVHIDRTEWGLASDLSHQIIMAYEELPKSLLIACNISHSFLKSPYKNEKPIFGEWKWDFRVYIAHTLVAA